MAAIDGTDRQEELKTGDKQVSQPEQWNTVSILGSDSNNRDSQSLQSKTALASFEPVSNDGTLNFGSFDVLYGNKKQSEGEKPGDDYTDKPGSKGNGPDLNTEEGRQDALAQSLQNIDENGVDQQGYGNCVFESSLAALASTSEGQELIKDMIKVTPEGYEVTFAGDKNNPVTVTPEDLKDSNLNSSEALWAKVIEKAAVKRDPKTGEGGNPPEGSNLTPAQYQLSLLTGNDASKFDASDSGFLIFPGAEDKIDDALKNGEAVVAFCKDDGVENDGLHSSHEYTVTGYDPETGTITVRNPWGNNNGFNESTNGVTPLPDGQMSMSYDTFKKYFGEVTVARA